MQKEANYKRANSKKAISLIVLVITIIVMVILAGAVIISLNNSGIITQANNAVRSANTKTVKEMAQVYWGEAYASGKRTQEDIEDYVINAFTKSGIDISGYDLTVTTNGVEVEKLMGIQLSNYSLELDSEETATLTVTMNEVTGTTTWTNSNEGVVTLSSTSGNSITVTAVGSGTAILTATLGNYTKTCNVTVKASEVAYITITDNQTFSNISSDDNYIIDNSATVTFKDSVVNGKILVKNGILRGENSRFKEDVVFYSENNQSIGGNITNCSFEKSIVVNSDVGLSLSDNQINNLITTNGFINLYGDTTAVQGKIDSKEVNNITSASGKGPAIIIYGGTFLEDPRLNEGIGIPAGYMVEEKNIENRILYVVKPN